MFATGAGSDFPPFEYFCTKADVIGAKRFNFLTKGYNEIFQ